MPSESNQRVDGSGAQIKLCADDHLGCCELDA